MNITALLRKLTAIPGVSGREAVVSEPLLELLKEYCPDAALVQGNIIGTFGKRESGKPHVLLDAHFDQVGLIVTYIDENGFLKVGNLGGLDLRLFPAQTVTVHGTSDIPGVVCAMPPHLLAGDADVADITDILIDTGYSKEELVADFGKTENLSQIYNGTEPTKKYIISCIKRAMEYRDEAVSDKKDDLIKKACTYIGENYSNEDISLNMVAKYVGVSPNHFSTMFAQNMNKTFVEYLTDVRMEQAKILLRTTNMRTSDIAFEVGYHDSHYFSSLFKKNQNMTPREYRAAN